MCLRVTHLTEVRRCHAAMPCAVRCPYAVHSSRARGSQNSNSSRLPVLSCDSPVEASRFASPDAPRAALPSHMHSPLRYPWCCTGESLRLQVGVPLPCRATPADLSLRRGVVESAESGSRKERRFRRAFPFSRVEWKWKHPASSTPLYTNFGILFVIYPAQEVGSVA